MMHQSGKHSIKAQVPRGEVGDGAQAITDADVIDGYLSDASRLRGSAQALFRPRNEAEIADILRRAQETSTPVTVVAEQTSTTGSSVPDGGWILSMEKLTAPGKINEATQSATAEGGIILGQWQRELEAAGWLYPPDPTSRHECSLGASVACNASGACTFKYGATRRYIRRLRVVLASGGVLHITRGAVTAGPDGLITIEGLGGDIRTLSEPRFSEPTTKHAAGYTPGPGVDLIDLFIGSEGTLGVITEVEADLLPLPEAIFSLMYFFPTEEAALSFVELARALARDDTPAERAISPRCLEYFDAAALTFIREAMPELGVPEEAAAGIFSEQECTASTQEALLEAWFERLTEAGALVEHDTGVIYAETPAQLESFRKARHAVPAGVNETAAKNGMPKVGTDLAVPDSCLREIFALYHRAADNPRAALPPTARRALLSELGQTGDDDTAWRQAGLPDRLRAVTFGHVGDNHVHVNFLPESEAALSLAKAVYAQLTRDAVAMGGTPSAEHGIGKIKVTALRELVGAEGMAQMLAIKDTLDPAGILGRGNLFGGAQLSR